jgi:NAD(P)-dependent dehydrogenase (short-subunit alcohol dehydrogenase family)
MDQYDYGHPYGPFQFDGKVLLVVGGARNAGALIARMGAARGAKVVIADVLDDRGEEVAKQIRKAGGEACFTHCDVTVEEQCQATVATAVGRFGGLDLAANNQGYFKFISHVADFPSDQYDAHMKVNAYGTFYLVKHEIAQMVKQGRGGAIVNTSSLVGLRSQPDMVGYVASKHAVNGVTKTAADEYADQGIRVNAICPGSILTEEMAATLAADADHWGPIFAHGIPMGRVSYPHEQAEVVLWLLSESSSYVNGAIIPVDGGKYTAH